MGFLVSKEAPAKLLLLAEAPLRERESLSPSESRAINHALPGSGSGGGIKAVGLDLSECVSSGLRRPPPS